MFADDFAFCAIATDEMEGGQEVFDEMKKDRQGGMPWMAILDGEGKELATSNDPDGKNVGCPVETHELKHFLNMLKMSADLSDDKVAAISAALDVHAKKFK